MTTALIFVISLFPHKALRRRWVERTLHRIGLSRRRALQIARRIP